MAIDTSFGLTARSQIVYLKGVRVLPFAAIYQPEVNLSEKEQYSVTCSITAEQYKFLEGEIVKAARRQWKDKAEQVLATIPATNRGIREVKLGAGETGPGIKATRYAKDSKGNTIKPPKIMQRNKEPSTSDSVDSVRPGDYVVLYVDPRAYDYRGVKGIKFDFVGMQYQAEGPSLEGRKAMTDDDFEDLAVEDQPNW